MTAQPQFFRIYRANKQAVVIVVRIRIEQVVVVQVRHIDIAKAEVCIVRVTISITRRKPKAKSMKSLCVDRQLCPIYIFSPTNQVFNNFINLFTKLYISFIIDNLFILT